MHHLSLQNDVCYLWHHFFVFSPWGFKVLMKHAAGVLAVVQCFQQICSRWMFKVAGKYLVQGNTNRNQLVLAPNTHVSSISHWTEPGLQSLRPGTISYCADRGVPQLQIIAKHVNLVGRPLPPKNRQAETASDKWAMCLTLNSSELFGDFSTWDNFLSGAEDAAQCHSYDPTTSCKGWGESTGFSVLRHWMKR